jgi:hypothetical protein
MAKKQLRFDHELAFAKVLHSSGEFLNFFLAFVEFLIELPLGFSAYFSPLTFTFRLTELLK